MKLTIRIKLLIGFALLVLLASLVQTFAFSITRQYITSQIDNLQTDQAKKGATEVENFLTTLSLDSFGLTRLLGKGELSTDSISSSNIEPVAGYIIKNKDYIKKIAILSPAGRELVKFDGGGEVAKEKLNYEVFSDPFKSAVNGTTTISKVYFIENELGPYIDMFSPIFSGGGKVTGIIKTQVSLSKLQDGIKDIKSGKNGYLYVVDNEGRLIAHHTQSFVLQRPDLSNRKIIYNALHNTPITTQDENYVNENNIPVVAKAIKVAGYNWVVIFEQPVAEAFGFLTFIRNIFFATLIGSSIFLFLISFVLSANLTGPIRKLQKSAQLLEAGQLNSNIDIKSGDEIETLSHSFAGMVNQLLEREKLLKQEKRETETLLQSLTDGVVALDQEGKIIAFNKAA